MGGVSAHPEERANQVETLLRWAALAERLSSDWWVAANWQQRTTGIFSRPTGHGAALLGCELLTCAQLRFVGCVAFQSCRSSCRACHPSVLVVSGTIRWNLAAASDCEPSASNMVKVEGAQPLMMAQPAATARSVAPFSILALLPETAGQTRPAEVQDTAVAMTTETSDQGSELDDYSDEDLDVEKHKKDSNCRRTQTHC